MLLHNFDFCWEVIIHGSLISVGTFCSTLSFQDVCVVNILRRQRQHFPLDQRMDLFAVQCNKDNICLWNKGWIDLLTAHYKRQGFSKLQVPFVVVQLLSRVQLIATPWIAAHQTSLSFPISRSLLKLISIESVMSSNHLTLCRPLFLMPSIFPIIRIISNESALRIKWPSIGASASVLPINIQR